MLLREIIAVTVRSNFQTVDRNVKMEMKLNDIEELYRNQCSQYIFKFSGCFLLEYVDIKYKVVLRQSSTPRRCIGEWW
jgi:hypothetical protein